MILGEICTRSCKFCATDTGVPNIPDSKEPLKLAEAVSKMNLNHCVITSVTRDDLEDGGATHWARVILKCREINPQTTIEVLIPDFKAKESLLNIVLEAQPDIVAHNIETVRRLTDSVRSKAQYDCSLMVLNYVAKAGFLTKSGLMLGLGEREDEVIETLNDLYKNGCRVVTLGQYLQPTRNNIVVSNYITPEQFGKYKEIALSIGFDNVESGPLVRSSYMAEKAAYLCKPYNK